MFSFSCTVHSTISASGVITPLRARAGYQIRAHSGCDRCGAPGREMRARWWHQRLSIRLLDIDRHYTQQNTTSRVWALPVFFYRTGVFSSLAIIPRCVFWSLPPFVFEEAAGWERPHSIRQPVLIHCCVFSCRLHLLPFNAVRLWVHLGHRALFQTNE